MKHEPQDLTGCHKPMQANCSKEIIQVSGERANFRPGVSNLKTKFPKVTEKFINSILRMHKLIWVLDRIPQGGFSSQAYAKDQDGE